MKLYKNRYFMEICDNGTNIELFLKYCVIYKKIFQPLIFNKQKNLYQQIKQ